MEDMEQIDQEIMDEMRDEQQDDGLENSEDQTLEQMGIHESYGAPEPEEKHNQYTFLHKAAYGVGDTVKTTYLDKEELGRPILSVRTLMDLYSISRFYIDELLVKLKLDPTETNKIANYLWNKTQNVTASGMSNEGFVMNLNSTRRMDINRKRTKDYSIFDDKKKGGKK